MRSDHAPVSLSPHIACRAQGPHPETVGNTRRAICLVSSTSRPPLSPMRWRVSTHNQARYFARLDQMTWSDVVHDLGGDAYYVYRGEI